ncbi:hypothetical protein TUM17569_02940 [Klebsiella oxytoca]|nr:hypothetical protein TUM17568_10700 [Klebsiella oxytoca]GJK94833.1 hypothetical protein TUM17569_02940 [Klebsiella oxytoca]
MFLEHNVNFNNFETLQMSPDGKDLSHIASEITSGRKRDENGEDNLSLHRSLFPGGGA